MKDKQNQKCTRVRCNLLEAEVYVRFPVRICGKEKVRQYVELQEVPCQNGIQEQYVLVDYPVTADSVNSFAESADYHTNPEVVNRAQPRQNLNDITEAQKILRNDMSGLRDLLASSKDVLAKLEEYQKTQGVVKVKEKGDDENGEEV